MAPIKRKKVQRDMNNLIMMSKLPKIYNSDDSKKENGRIPEMSMTTLPFNTKRGTSVESYMQNKKKLLPRSVQQHQQSLKKLYRGQQIAIQKRNSTPAK